MNFKKFITIPMILLYLCFTLSFSGCIGGDDGSNTTQNSGKQLNLKYLEARLNSDVPISSVGYNNDKEELIIAYTTSKTTNESMNEELNVVVSDIRNHIESNGIAYPKTLKFEITPENGEKITVIKNYDDFFKN
ncbi:hypothetical protein [Methanococcus voltae]|uniref:Lipoprotein n=1 Tax=Methanococcus voltae (strain ATCC BAA-1334 / A3) TaxID=456320 RepID=D7DSH9_METV3|nr:hypothetical protein [Methanococcus voltae]MCS3901990.1 hypothetical protein [Methanococcus voltae]